MINILQVHIYIFISHHFVLVRFLICSPEDHYPLRLTGGNSTNNGRLEIRVGGTWGTIAEANLQNWTLTAAHVACHQLGYDKAIHVQWYGSGGSGPIHLTDVKCNGNEGAIAVCSHSQFGVINPALNHNHDIYLFCHELIGKIFLTRSRKFKGGIGSPVYYRVNSLRNYMTLKITLKISFALKNLIEETTPKMHSNFSTVSNGTLKFQ